MNPLLLAAIASAALVASACSGPTEVRDAFGATGEVVALGGGSGGAALACVSCHGLKGEGDGNRSPRLAGLDRGYILRQFDFYANGQRAHAQMARVATALTAAERHKVATYYAAQQVAGSASCGGAGSATAQLLYSSGDRARGIASCASCHGASGEGNAGNPPLAGQPAAYLARQLDAWRGGERYGDPLGVMTHIAKVLTPAEAAALTAYAARLPGGRGYPESTARCPPARRASPKNGA